MQKKITVLLVLLLWSALSLGAWLAPAKDISEAERRPLAQFPEITGEKLLSGKFMSEFTDYTLDQFPLRDSFRRVKSLFHYNVLGQKDNNGIYLSGGSAVQQEYPMKDASVAHALERFQSVYDRYLQNANVYLSIVPDKGYYLAETAGQLRMDYEALLEAVQEGMPWAVYLDLTEHLTGEDYYRTDTHWRQEALLDAAKALCAGMGVTSPEQEEFTQTVLERPFYGVYYGQAALPMEPDTIRLLESDWLRDCTVYDHETGKIGTVYDLSKLESKDLYDVYLSGARALLTVENPNAATDRELILFRDSFGSSMAPLLMKDYARVTLVDLRYLHSDMLGQLVEFDGKDVLFLYSTLVLNNSASLK